MNTKKSYENNYNKYSQNPANNSHNSIYSIRKLSNTFTGFHPSSRTAFS
ncbi:hypothetical protein M086_3295, partial [Bacteroides fragilis str. S13 L11]